MALYWQAGALSSTQSAVLKTLTEAATSLLLYNEGTASVFIEPNGAAVADTSHFELASGKSITIDVDKRSAGIKTFGYICDTGLTATLHFAAMRGIQTR